MSGREDPKRRQNEEVRPRTAHSSSARARVFDFDPYAEDGREELGFADVRERRFVSASGGGTEEEEAGRARGTGAAAGIFRTGSAETERAREADGERENPPPASNEKRFMKTASFLRGTCRAIGRRLTQWSDHLFRDERAEFPREERAVWSEGEGDEIRGRRKTGGATLSDAATEREEQSGEEEARLRSRLDEMDRVLEHSDSASFYRYELRGEGNLLGVTEEQSRGNEGSAARASSALSFAGRKQDKPPRGTGKERSRTARSLSRNEANSAAQRKNALPRPAFADGIYLAENTVSDEVGERIRSRRWRRLWRSLSVLTLCTGIFLFLFAERCSLFEIVHDPQRIYQIRAKAVTAERNSAQAKAEMEAIRKVLTEISQNKNRLSLAGENNGLFVDDTKINESFDRSRIQSDKIYLYNLTDDVPVFAWKAQQSGDCGAITQIFTTALYMEVLKNPQKFVQVPPEIVRYLYEQTAKQSGFDPGEQCMMIDLAYGAVLEGATDCAMAEAYYVSGKQSEFVRLLNERAQKLGLRNTHFANASGLPSDQHYASAEDLAVFFREVVKMPRMLKIITTRKHRSAESEHRPDGLEMKNNVLEYFDKHPIAGVKILGGRSGANPKSGRSLLTLSEKNGKRYILVTLEANRDRGTDAKDHYEDHRMILSELLK